MSKVDFRSLSDKTAKTTVIDPQELNISLRVGPSKFGHWAPTFDFSSEIMSADNCGWASGSWRMFIWSLSTQAQAAATAVRAVNPDAPSEVAILPSGEGVFIVCIDPKSSFKMEVTDRRSTLSPLRLSWLVSHADALSNFTSEPNTSDRAKIVANIVRQELALVNDLASAAKNLSPTEAEGCSIVQACAGHIRTHVAEVFGSDVAEALPESTILERSVGIAETITGSIEALAEEAAFDMMSTMRM
jgi:hypothetical protein